MEHNYSKHDHVRRIDTVVQVVHILWCFCAGIVWWDETRALKQLGIWNGMEWNNGGQEVMDGEKELQRYLVMSSPPHSEHG